MNIQDLLSGSIGNQLVGNLSKQLGVDDSKVSSAVAMAIPSILGQMNKNAQTPQGAESLNKALENHSNPSLLDNIGGLLGGGNASSEGLGILGHVFGGKQEEVAETIGTKTGLSSGNVMQILSSLAPILMGFLGNQKQQNNIGADGISSLLSGVLGGGSSSSGLMGMAEKILDQNGDGNITDDVMNMGSKLLKGFFNK